MKIHAFVVSYNILYRVTDLNSKEMSRKRVKQLVVPQKLVPEILKIIHASPEFSLPGKEKTYKQTQIKYYWIHMKKDIYNYVDNCQKCAETKGSKRSSSPMLNYPVPDGPWKRVNIDTLELPVSENEFKYLLVAIDYFSRFCILQRVMNKRAETIASIIYSHIIA